MQPGQQLPCETPMQGTLPVLLCGRWPTHCRSHQTIQSAQRSSVQSELTQQWGGSSPGFHEPGALLNRHQDLMRGQGLLDIISCQQAIVIMVKLNKQSAGQKDLIMS